MKDSTEKQLNGEPYWVDYPFDGVGLRYDPDKKKFYVKPYGKDEYEATKDQGDWLADIVSGGKEIDEEKYESL